MKFKKMTLLEKIQTIVIVVLVLIIVVIGTNYINKLYKSNTEKEYNSINYLDGNNEGHTVEELYTLLQTMETRVNNLSVQTQIENLTNKDNSNNLFLKTYPVGSIYISNTNTNPGTIFGGTWAAFGTGRTLVGVDTSQTEFDTVEETGGEKTHTLTIAETPSHTHTRGTMDIIGEFRAYSEYNLNNTNFATKLKGPFWYNTNESDNYGTSTDLSSGSSDTVRQIHFQASRAWTGETSSVGGDGAHNNLQPYITVYMWKRTA